MISTDTQDTRPTAPPHAVQDSDAESTVATADENEPVAPSVEFRHVSFSFEDKKILDDISFKLVKGEIKINLSGSGAGTHAEDQRQIVPSRWFGNAARIAAGVNRAEEIEY